MPPPAPAPGEPYIPLSEQEAAAADKDFLYFLRHVRIDGHAYSLVIPPEDGASSPPHIIRYEYDQPLPDHHNAGTRVAGSRCRGRRTSPLSEEENNGATSSEAPRGVKRKAPDASPGGEARSGGGAVPMEEDTPTPVAEQAWYDSHPEIDEDYRSFLQHLSELEDKLVLKMGNSTITLGDVASVDDRDAEEEVEEEEEEEEEEGEDDDELEGSASGQSGESIPASDSEHGVDLDLPIKVKDEEVSRVEEDSVGLGSDLQIVNDPVYYETKAREEVEQPLKALVRGGKDFGPLDRKEASSSKGLLKMPLNASEPQGVIWPPHINERPDSAFKEKLIEFLVKPFTREEYDRYFALATNRTPMVRERRTRNKVAYYPWTHEMGKSYFDRYPDLAEQFSLQCNNYPNGLALLRGLFFWLQNIGQEDQFRPWSDAFKKYRVVPLKE